MTKDPVKEIHEIRNQLSYSKRIGFLFGAGTSKAIGIPDIKELTKKVIEKLEGQFRINYGKIVKSLPGKDHSIEDVLNHIRLIRKVTGESEDKTFEGINGSDAKCLDLEICQRIYEIIVEEERKVNIKTPQKFVSWLNWLNRDFSKEIFTTNYDLILERAFESLLIPFFDGFVGANEPFFLPESLEKDMSHYCPPTAWIRLWKLHGSLGWFWKENKGEKSDRIVRQGINAIGGTCRELLIYPSREKYNSSRKQPFISYFDKLRSFLLDGEGLFIISGYSFYDEHVNNILFDCLRQNNRLHIISFFFDDNALSSLHDLGHLHMNLSAYSPKKVLLRGDLYDWQKDKEDSLLKDFWDDQKGLLLGDFNKLVDFFLYSSGRLEKVEQELSVP